MKCAAWLGKTLAVGSVAVVAAAAPVAAQQADVSERPTFTPYTAKPELLSPAEVREEMIALYPPLLRDAGIGGTAMYWLFIDRTGEVSKVELEQSSGYDSLDAAAAELALAMRFRPAKNRDRAVDVWVKLPVTFSPEAAGAAAESEKRSPARPPASKRASGSITEAPTFTPYTEAPELANRLDVGRALTAAYPPLLRDAGIGGTAQVWVLIDEDGTVAKAQLAEASGEDAIDQAALSVAGRMRFNPARNRGDEVIAWIRLPITFTAK